MTLVAKGLMIQPLSC